MQFVHGPITALLCLSLLGPSTSILAQNPPAPSSQPTQSANRPAPRPAYQSSQVQGDDRILLLAAEFCAVSPHLPCSATFWPLRKA